MGAGRVTDMKTKNRHKVWGRMHGRWEVMGSQIVSF